VLLTPDPSPTTRTADTALPPYVSTHAMSTSTSTCLITHRPDLGVLVARWLDNAPLTQLQADFTALLAEAEQHGTPRWLLDVRRRDQLSPELGHWTTSTFYPLAATKLFPQQLRISVLCSPARMAVYETSTEQKEYLSYGLSNERTYRMRLFGEEGAAMQWLLG